MSRACVALAIVVATATAAHAEGDREQRARAHYEVGLGMYHLGNYREALREFSAGYELSPRPQFLINLGQVYRKLHDLEHAREMFARYLTQTPTSAPDRHDVQQLLEEVERERAQAPPPLSPSSDPTPPPASTAPPPSDAPAPSLAPAATTPSVVAVPAAPPRRSAIRRYWWTIPVGAVVLGAAVGLTLYFTLPPSQVACTSATINCVDLRP